MKMRSESPKRRYIVNRISSVTAGSVVAASLHRASRVAAVADQPAATAAGGGWDGCDLTVQRLVFVIDDTPTETTNNSANYGS